MLAAAGDGLPRDAALGGLAYEQKADGYRALVFAGPGRAHLQSRNGSDLTPAFPDLAAATRALPETMVLDGECVVASGAAWTSVPSRPGVAVVVPPGRQRSNIRRISLFDVLELAGCPPHGPSPSL
ncbi:ATP-dependent DNA ligase [Streptomyces fragilis]|uniref:ATP-dependent DNA ligase family profile domain-containing protein n=1 Tax=Streptomyces fragilis TaxID=67301 RepID=A0ABV2YCF1_9ACTN